MDDRLKDNYLRDALKKGRSEGDVTELLDDVSNFFLSRRTLVIMLMSM